MDLRRIRRGLCEFLAGLEPDVWCEARGFVERLRSVAPDLILDPATREPDRRSNDLLHRWDCACTSARKGPKPPRPDVTYDDIYANFREQDPKDRWTGPARQLTTRMPDGFHRVEGRFVEFFLREIPYLMGFVDLAWRRVQDRHGLNVVPPFERLRAFRLTRRLAAVWRSDPELDRVTTRVLPNLEIVVDAPSYPERVLEAIAPYTERVREDGPVHQLRLERRKVVAAVAADRAHRDVAEVLAGLVEAALPENIATELASWCGHAEKVTLYEGLGLVEIADPAARPAVRAALGQLVADDRPAGFLIVREPKRAFALLEEKELVPLHVGHREAGFTAHRGGAFAASGPDAAAESGARAGAGTDAGACPRAGALAAPSAAPAAAPPRRVRIAAEDLVGYRSDDAAFLQAVRDALVAEAGGEACRLLEGDGLLVVAARALPKVRAVLRRLADRFQVEA